MATRSTNGVEGEPSTASALQEAWRWIREYLFRPREQIGRPGPVCPFAEPAARAGSLCVEVRRTVTVPTDANLDALLWQAVDDFATIDWPHANQRLHALAVVLPDLDEAHYELLDLLHGRSKGAIVERGLMLGQFHPRCPEPAVRNPAFLVARSPVPMLVVRHMAFHDILFLHQRGDWFMTYARRFGRQYRHADGQVDSLFREHFDRACKRHGFRA